MSVADNADWGRTAERAACERWPLEHVAGDDGGQCVDGTEHSGRWSTWR